MCITTIYIVKLERKVIKISKLDNAEQSLIAFGLDESTISTMLDTFYYSYSALKDLVYDGSIKGNYDYSMLNVHKTNLSSIRSFYHLEAELDDVFPIYERYITEKLGEDIHNYVTEYNKLDKQLTHEYSISKKGLKNIESSMHRCKSTLSDYRRVLSYFISDMEDIYEECIE